MSEEKDSKPWQDRQTLERLYIDENLQQKEVASRLDVDYSTVRYWLKKHDIRKPWKDEETLRRLYHQEGLSTGDIGDKLGCSDATINRWMEKMGVEKRSPGAYKRSKTEPWHDKSTLQELYHGKGLSQWGIADKFDCSPSTISYWMEKFEIEIKDARGKGDLTAADTPAPFTHKREETDRTILNH